MRHDPPTAAGKEESFPSPWDEAKDLQRRLPDGSLQIVACDLKKNRAGEGPKPATETGFYILGQTLP